MRMSYQNPPNRDADEETAEVPLRTTDPTTRDHRVSQRRSALVAGVLLLLLVMMAGGGAVGRWEGASSTTTTTAVPDRVVGTLPVYDPSHDYCFVDSTLEQFCWYPTQNYQVGNWKLLHIRINECGISECPAPLPPPPLPAAPVYDPTQDYCFLNTDTVGKFCWYPTKIIPVGNWITEGTHNENDCGPVCPAPPPTPPPTPFPTVPPPMYDPSQDFCFHDKDNTWKYCWYPKDHLPDGNWKGEGGHGYNDCGDLCYHYDNVNGGTTSCVPAPDPHFSGYSTTTYGGELSGRTNPFETCYQYEDTDKYCWSHSYYDDRTVLPWTSGWFQCIPNPKGKGWHDLDPKYVNTPGVDPTIRPYRCGDPCQEMYQQFGSGGW